LLAIGGGWKPIQKFFAFWVRRLSSLTPIALLLARVLPPLDRWWFRMSKGRQTLTGLLADVPVVMVTTVGAKSGKVRQTPLLPIRDPDRPTCLALIATNFGQERYPQWYFNLKKHPQAQCAMHGEQKAYLVREAEGEEYQRYWQLAEATFFGYRVYRQRIRSRHIPILILEPLDRE
jgi:deazaflavin-dependent oxidoreductase (nitroreductase family)